MHLATFDEIGAGHEVDSDQIGRSNFWTPPSDEIEVSGSLTQNAFPTTAQFGCPSPYDGSESTPGVFVS